MVNPLSRLKQFTHPEPQLPDASAGDPEIEIRKQQHRVNSQRAHFWKRVSQLSFWAMAATLTGGVFGAAASNPSFLADLGAMAGVPALVITLGVGITLGAISLVASSIENRINEDNRLNFQEINAKNIGKHTGEEVVKAMVTIVEQAKARHQSAAMPAREIEDPKMGRPSSSSIPVGIARDSTVPATRIETTDALSQGTSKITLPVGVTLH